MKYEKIKKKLVVGKIRARQIFLMILALSVIFAGVPYSLHLLKKWNDIVPGGTWSSMEENDFKVEEIGTGSSKVGLAYGENQYSQSTVVWNDETGNHSWIIENGRTDDSSMMYWFLNTTLQGLINKNGMKLNWSINLPLGEHVFGIVFYEMVDNKVVHQNIATYPYNNDPHLNGLFYDDLSENKGDYPGGDMDKRSWINGSLEMEVIDLMMSKIEVGGSVGVALCVWSFYPDSEINTGDTINFEFRSYQEPNTAIKSVTIMNIGALVIGIILILIGIASTGYWNPLPDSKKGPIDKWILRVTGRVRRK